jgi:hypothetical protein
MKMKIDTLIENIESKFEQNRLTLWDVVEKLQTVKTTDVVKELIEKKSDALTPLDVLILDVASTDSILV